MAGNATVAMRTGPDATELLRLMHEQADDHAVILLDANGAVVAWMMGAARIFGRDAEAMLGATIECLFTPEDRAAGAPRTEREHAERSGKAEDDRWMLRSDGVRFWASGFLDCLRHPDGSVAGFAKVLRDRTDVRGQIEALRNRAEALEADDARNAVMLGTLAHELRNPLAVLTNAADLIDLAHPGDAKLAYALHVLRRQTSYVRTVIDDVLEMARIRTGKATLRTERVALGAIADDAVEMVSQSFRDRRQALEVLLPPHPVELEADRVRLTQVLVNLLANASKFSDVGGRVWVKVVVEADEVVVRVVDEGCGIAPEMLPHVFELLSQAAPQPHERDRGLGLGLALVKEYVELHGGVVQVRSEGIGCGSEFAIRLPLPPEIAAGRTQRGGKSGETSRPTGRP
jgi:two-component system CheB/CheR fusion protein